MEHFTPVASLMGGMLIGLSASALLFFDGKIAGISGIIAGLLSRARHDTLWRAVFVAGLITGGFLCSLLSPPDAGHRSRASFSSGHARLPGPSEPPGLLMKRAIGCT